jgi:hypothetical protein
MMPKTLLEIIEAGEPYTVDSINMLCLQCPLSECDESKHSCLVKMALRRNKKLQATVYLNNWLAKMSPEELAVYREKKRIAVNKSTFPKNIKSKKQTREKISEAQ